MEKFIPYEKLYGKKMVSTHMDHMRNVCILVLYHPCTDWSITAIS